MFFSTLLFAICSKEIESQSQNKNVLVDSCYERPSENVVDLPIAENTMIHNYYTVYGCNVENKYTITINADRLLLYGCKFNSVKGAIYCSTFDTSEFSKQVNIITKCEFTNCESDRNGGAIYVMTYNPSYDIQITDSLFENCKATDGGAIHITTPKGTIQNCRFIKNTAKGNGNDISFTSVLAVSFSVTKCNFNVDSNSGKSMFYINVNGQYNFHFLNNAITIENQNTNYHLFDSMADSFSGVLEFSGNCMTPSEDKTIIKSSKAQSLNIDLEKDFGSCQNSFEPVIPDEQEVIDETKCTSNDRCKFEEQETKAIYVIIKITKFNDISKSGLNGGALYISNAGLKCDETTFTKCTASNGGGGAIYAKYTYNLPNSMSFEKLKISQCKASYGGGLYIYSNSEENYVSIQSCVFDSNSILEGGNTQIHGGSAMYLTINKGRVNDCNFKGVSKSGLIKFTNNFDEVSGLNLLDKSNSFVISKCSFEHDDKSTTAIYCVCGNSLVCLHVYQCTFKGKLSKGNYFIDGELTSNDAKSRVSVNDCKFDNYDIKVAVNNKIVTNCSDGSKVENFLSLISNNLVEIAFCVTFFTVVVAFFVIKKIKSNNDENGDDITNELKESLIKKDESENNKEEMII